MPSQAFLEHNPAAIVFVPPHPREGTRPPPLPPSGAARVAGLVANKAAALQQRTDQGHRAVATARAALDTANALRTQFRTKETQAAVVAAATDLDFAQGDLALALSAARDFQDLVAASQADLDLLAVHDAAQSDAAVDVARAALLKRAADAAAVLAQCVVEARALATEIDIHRGAASDCARRLGLSWSGSRSGYFDTRRAVREVLRQAWRAAGFDSENLRELVG